MAVRERSRSFPVPDGTVTDRLKPRNGSWTIRGTANQIGKLALYQEFEDITGNRGGFNPALSYKFTRRGGIVNGSWRGGNWNDPNSRLTEIQWVNWPITNYYNTVPGHLDIPNVPSDVWCATEAASRSNPSQPRVAIPVSIAEMKDIPKMIRNRLRKISKINPTDAFDTVVELNFGWGPILSDIKRMFELMEAIEKRFRKINRLAESPQLSLRRTVFSETKIENTDVETTVSYDFARPIREKGHRITTRYDIVGTAVWKPAWHLAALTREERIRETLRVLTGLQPSFTLSALYELVPWSWAIDYFVNLGKLMSLTNNRVADLTGPVSISRVRETTYESKGLFIESSGGFTVGSVSPYMCKRRDWSRTFSYPGLSFELPILTTQQVLTIASIVRNYR